MKDNASIRVISRALDVLRIINRHGSLSLMEISKTVDLPYPTALRIVRALVEEGVIEREPMRKHYRATPLIQALAYGFQNHDNLVAVARPHIVALTSTLHWPISVVTRVGKFMVVRDSTSTQTPMTFNHYYPGWQVPLVQSASGRAYLAYADSDTREQMIAHLEATGSEAEVAMLRDLEESGESERIRRQGYAAVMRTSYSANPGRTSSIAVPLNADGELLGSLTLVFFSAALTMDKAVASYLEPMQQTALQITRDLAKQTMAA